MKKIVELKARELFDALLSRLRTDYDQHEADNVLFLALEDKLKISRAQWLANRTLRLEEKQMHELYGIIDRLNRHEPIQYILGQTSFFGMTFIVNPSVLIPRPETEELVQLAINDKPDKDAKLLDIGTGSGCIAVSLKKNLPHTTVHALDNSAEALQVAKANAQLNGCEILFFQSDILREPFPGGEYDVLVSNPPYVCVKEKALMERNVLDFEPKNALFVPDESPLLFYERIMELGKTHLKAGGKLYFEINEQFGEEIKALFAQAGYGGIRVFQDLNGKDRMARAVRP